MIFKDDTVSLGSKCLSGREFINTREDIVEKFSVIAREKNFSEALAYLRHFLFKNPSHRFVAIDLFGFFRNTAGRSSIADELASIFADVTAYQSKISQAIWNSPLICETPSIILRRIGEASDQVAATIQMRELGVINEKPVLFVPDRVVPVNQAMLPYIEDAFEVISDKNEIEKLKPFLYTSFYNSYITKISDSVSGHNGEIVTGAYDILKKNGLNPFSLKLKDETKVVALEFLRDFDISSNDKFVAFHVREAGYFDAPHHELRNNNPEILETTIDFILSQGLKVLRIGHQNMSDISARPGLIDLTSTEHPGEVDIFACSESEFFIGNPSGPFSLAYNFGTPTLQIGVFGYYGHGRLNGLLHMQPIQNNETGKILSLQEIKLLDLQKICASNPYKIHNLSPLPLEKNDLLRATKNMMEFKVGSQLEMLNYKFEREKSVLGIHPELMFTEESLKYL